MKVLEETDLGYSSRVIFHYEIRFSQDKEQMKPIRLHLLSIYKIKPTSSNSLSWMEQARIFNSKGIKD